MRWRRTSHQVLRWLRGRPYRKRTEPRRIVSRHLGNKTCVFREGCVTQCPWSYNCLVQTAQAIVTSHCNEAISITGTA